LTASDQVVASLYDALTKATRATAVVIAMEVAGEGEEPESVWTFTCGSPSQILGLATALNHKTHKEWDEDTQKVDDDE